MRIRLPKRTFIFRVTREGGVFLLLTAIVGGAAFAKGVNLIFLVFAVMICFALLSSVLAIVGMNNLTVARVLPTHVFAGKRFAVELIVTNRKRLVPAISVVVYDTVGRERLQARYVVKVPPRASVSTTYQHVFERRGEFEFRELVMETSFPLGFFARGFAVMKREPVIVYPKIVRLNPNFLVDVLNDIEARLNKPGMGTELFGFRKYAHGDDRRFINWKLSAKTGELVVTNFSQDQNLDVTIVFDNAVADPTEAELARFEDAVTFAASLGSFFVEKNFKVQMLTRSGTVPFGEGNRQLLKMLTHLALIEAAAASAETDDIYNPKRLGNSIGILISHEPIRRPLPHFIHTFHASGRHGGDSARPAFTDAREPAAERRARMTASQ